MAATPALFTESYPTVDPVSVFEPIRSGLRNVIQGRDEVIDLILVALLADGHVLLEDHPGSGKTTLARTLGGLIETGVETDLPSFRRIQFTPDLMPSDILGVSIFDPQTSSFNFRRGPLFAHLLLADEINRTSPKVQAALLEAMAEKQVTAEDRTLELDSLFMVLATQNPFDAAGTYPLPAAQLDRFLFRIRMGYLDPAEELAMLQRTPAREQGLLSAAPVKREDILAARRWAQEEVFVSDAIYQSLVEIANALRAHSQVAQGPSSRSLVQMVSALKASAALDGREFVSAEDVRRLTLPVFGHRTHMAGARSRNIENETTAVIQECLRTPLETLIRTGLAKARPARPSAIDRR
jgi:MoxR-like ATPase